MKLSTTKIAVFCLLLLVFTAGATCTGIQNTTIWQQRTVNNSARVRPVAVAVRDIDGDGLLDVIAAYAGTTTVNPAVFIFFQSTVDSFTAVQAGSHTDLGGVAAIAVDDIDLDTRADIVAACNGRLVYLHNPGNPRTAADWTLSAIAQSNDAGIGQWNDVAIGDIDQGNGRDIVACAGSLSAGRLSWFQAPADSTSGTGWVRVDIDATTRINAAGVALDNINSDGRLDVFSTAPGETDARTAWYANPANPATDPWTKTAIGNEVLAARVTVADLNGDLLNDLVVTFPGNHRIGWYRKPADPTTAWSGFTLAQYTSDTPTDAKAADVDGDGHMDVVAGTQSAGSLRWFKPTAGDVTAQWVENNVKNLSEAVGRIALGDIDGDGRPDVVAPLQATSTSGDSVAWFLNPLP